MSRTCGLHLCWAAKTELLPLALLQSRDVVEPEDAAEPGRAVGWILLVDRLDGGTPGADDGLRSASGEDVVAGYAVLDRHPGDDPAGRALDGLGRQDRVDLVGVEADLDARLDRSGESGPAGLGPMHALQGDARALSDDAGSSDPCALGGVLLSGEGHLPARQHLGVGAGLGGGGHHAAFLFGAPRRFCAHSRISG